MTQDNDVTHSKVLTTPAHAPPPLWPVMLCWPARAPLCLGVQQSANHGARHGRDKVGGSDGWPAVLVMQCCVRLLHGRLTDWMWRNRGQVRHRRQLERWVGVRGTHAVPFACL